MQSLKKDLSLLFTKTLEAHAVSVPAAEVEASFQSPKEEKFGDLSTHLVLKVAKELKKPPRALAETLSADLWNAVKASPLASKF